MIKDPVCGMAVESGPISLEFDGRKYFFCSQGCLDRFSNSPGEFSRNYVYDLVIIGAGPAGLTAAVYASVSKIDTLIIAMDIGGQAVDSTKIKNYMGFDFITGKELIKRFEHQFLQKHYLDHEIDDVLSINQFNEDFEILTKGENGVLAHAVIIATGMRKRKLGIPGEERLLRKGVSYSSTQDTVLFGGLDVVVLGGGNSGIQVANDLRNAGCKVTLVTDRLVADHSGIEELKRSDDVDILEGYVVTEIQGEDEVEGVVIQPQNGMAAKHIPCRGVFIQTGLIPSTEFCQDLVELNEKGEIIINPDCSTNVEGIFACGDVTNCFGKRIIIASGEGAKAALSARRFLSGRKSRKQIAGTN